MRDDLHGTAKAPRQKALKNNMALSWSLYSPAVLARGFKKKIKIEVGNPLAKGAKNSSRGSQMLRSQRPWGHAFCDKYRPRAPGGLQLQRPGKGETESLRVPAKGSADTWCGQPGRGAATRRRGVQGRAGPRGDGSPPDGQTDADGQAGRKL